MTDWKAKEAERAARSAVLQAANPWARPAGANALTAAAANIRAELAAAFPAVKFSVRVRRFSGGDAIDIRWSDGPMTSQVDELVGKYAAGHFDGSDDSYRYSGGEWAAAFGDAKYVHTTRDNSEVAVEAAIRTVFARYPTALSETHRPSAAEYRAGKLWSVPIPDACTSYRCSDMQSLISVEISRRTWALPAKLLAKFAEQAEETAA